MDSRNIVITGFMGTGKTSVGRRLAERLGLRFVDMDSLLEERFQMSIADVFATRGEAFFRQAERELLAELRSATDTVIATGGGALLSTENRSLLPPDSIVVCLTCQPEEVLRRLANDDSRPLLAAADRLQRIRDVLAERKAIYDTIPHQVDTTGLTIDEVVDQIERLYDVMSSGCYDKYPS